MHELSICEALLTQVNTLAIQHQAQRVSRIVVQVGQLSGIEPELLAQAFSLSKVGTIAEQAELVLESLAVRVRCRRCGADSDVSANALLCKACGDWHTQLLSGNEMLLKSVELITTT